MPHRLFSSCGEWGLLSSCGAWVSHCDAFPYCGAQALGCEGVQLLLPSSRTQVQQLWSTGLVAPWHVGSAWIRDRTHVSYTGRRMLYHRATREALP